jgi:hypothetical protein
MEQKILSVSLYLLSRKPEQHLGLNFQDGARQTLYCTGCTDRLSKRQIYSCFSTKKRLSLFIHPWHFCRLKQPFIVNMAISYPVNGTTMGLQSRNQISNKGDDESDLTYEPLYSIRTMTTEAASTSETSVNLYQTTRRNMPKDGRRLARRHDKMKSHSTLTCKRDPV